MASWKWILAGCAVSLALPQIAFAACPLAGAPVWVAGATNLCDAYQGYLNKTCCAGFALDGSCIPSPGASSNPECVAGTYAGFKKAVTSGSLLLAIPGGYSGAEYFSCLDDKGSLKAGGACAAADERFSLYCTDWKTGAIKKDAACNPPAEKKVASGATVTKIVPLTGPTVLPSPLGNADLPTLIGRVVSTFLGIVGAASLLVFVYAGARYMTAGGREETLKHAKDTMKYAFIGLAIILFAYVVTSFFFQAILNV